MPVRGHSRPRLLLLCSSPPQLAARSAQLADHSLSVQLAARSCSLQLAARSWQLAACSSRRAVTADSRLEGRAGRSADRRTASAHAVAALHRGRGLTEGALAPGALANAATGMARSAWNSSRGLGDRRSERRLALSCGTAPDRQWDSSRPTGSWHSSLPVVAQLPAGAGQSDGRLTSS